jgi:hypothetical protein
MTFCPECGKENSADQKFCTGCGNPLKNPSVNPASPAVPPQTQNPPAASSPSQGVAVPPGSSRTLLLAGAVVVIIAIIAAAVFIGLPALSKSQVNSGTTGAKTTIPAQPTTVPAASMTESPVTFPSETITTISTTVPAETPSPYNTYTSSRFGFSMNYPRDWEVNERNQLKTPSLTRYNVVEFYSPSIDRCDTDRANCVKVRAVVTAEVETAPGTKELADYFVPETARILSENGAQITKRDAMYKLSGVKAYRLDYENEINSYDQNLISAYTLINNNAYILTYRAYAPIRGETDLFKEYYNNADDMFTSFNAHGAIKTLN